MEVGWGVDWKHLAQDRDQTGAGNLLSSQMYVTSVV
jgi:hypothetical protein